MVDVPRAGRPEWVGLSLHEVLGKKVRLASGQEGTIDYPAGGRHTPLTVGQVQVEPEGKVQFTSGRGALLPAAPASRWSERLGIVLTWDLPTILLTSISNRNDTSDIRPCRPLRQGKMRVYAILEGALRPRNVR